MPIIPPRRVAPAVDWARKRANSGVFQGTEPSMTVTTMRALNIPTPGGPEALVAEERPLPSVEPEEVLIKVAAAGVNRPDSLQRQGGYPPPPGASDVPGLEVSGTVVEAGRAVTDLHLGDQVCALLTGAVMPNTRQHPTSSACRFLAASTWSAPRLSRKPFSPCGPTCSIAAP